MTVSPRYAELLLGHEVPQGAEAPLVAVFTEAGLQPRVRRAVAYRGAAELGWLVLAAVPLHAFLHELGAQAVRDLHAAVRALAHRGPGRQPPAAADHRPPLVLQNAANGLRVVLEDDLPVEAYQQLVGLDLTRFHLGPLHYDRTRRAWRSELDEAGG